MDFRFDTDNLSRAVGQICRDVRKRGGRAVLVGGCVRDNARGVAAHDVDIEVYGIAAEPLLELLSHRWRVDLVGRAFGVIKVRKLPIDISLPRTESKSGAGHKGFDIVADPNLAFEIAAARRDFTINAMGYDLLSGELEDPFDGMGDLGRACLRHTSEKFSEDPLRVLRAMQFAARFDMTVAPETVALCRGIEPEGLASERLFAEWRKLLLAGVRPSVGLNFLRECGWVRYYPEAAAMIDCPQDPQWHPEGDVWGHTLHVLDAFARERVGDDWEDLVVGFACLCHDFGKPLTTTHDDGRIRSPGHSEAGIEPMRTFLERLTNQVQLIEEIEPLVLHHLRPVELHKAKSGDAAVRRLARKVGRIDRLVRVVRADLQGRPPKPFTGSPACDWLLERAAAMSVADSVPRRILLGRHLVDLGVPPGPRIGQLLNACYEAQLDGAFHDLPGAIAYARPLVAESVDENGE